MRTIKPYYADDSGKILIKRIRRYSIHVEIQHEDLHVAKITVGDVPRIKHLIITLGGHGSSYSRLMGALSRQESQIEGRNLKGRQNTPRLRAKSNPKSVYRQTISLIFLTYLLPVMVL